MRNLMLAAFLLCSLNTYAQNGGSKPGAPAAGNGVSGSVDTIPLRQMDGTVLHIIGLGNIFVSYTETIDGYTIVLDPNGMYEYAVQSKDGDLRTSGVWAHDPGDRDRKENKKLKNIPKHLRYQGEILKKMQEKQTRYDTAPKKERKNKK